MILSRTGGLQRQSNLFPFFLSLSLDVKHELKIHILDILNAVYLLLVQIGCFIFLKSFVILQQITPCRTDMVRKEDRRKSSSIYYGTRPHRCNNGRI